MADTVVVTIDGVDRTSQVLVDSLDITNMMAAASTATFAINAGAYAPTAWDEVVITINGTTVFGGYLVERSVEGVGPGSSKQARWHCECRDYTALFDKVLINTVSYGATVVTDRTIVQALFSTYLAADGFDTSSFVSQCYYGVTIGFDNMTLREALNKLASQVKAQWFVDCLKRVYWFSRYSPPNAALEIDTVTADAATRFDSRPSLTRQLDDSTIVNRLRVYGGWVQGAQTSNGFTTASATNTVGPLTARPHSVVQVSVQESASRRLFTGDQIGYVPEHVLYTDGLTANQREVIVDRDAKTIQIVMGAPVIPVRPPAAGATVVVIYYQATAIATTVNDTVSQAAYGRVLEHQVYNPALLTTEQATQYGLTWLTKYGSSQEHITFDVDVFGLQPGTMLQVNAPTLGVTVPDLGILLQSGDDLLGQNDAFFAQEINGVVGRYVIQTVRYQAIPTVGGVHILASVEAGEYEHTLLDMLRPVMSSQQAPTTTIANQLSDVATHMGELVAGRAVLTDGGTAAFQWDAFNGHTGVVVGLDPDYTLPQGAVLVLQGGTVRAKVGYMVGMGTVGTVAPSGWGIWTQNGYFQGVVAASTIIGGTVSGGLVTGGTVSGAVVSGGTLIGTAGTIGGFTIEANKLWSSGGTIQTGSVVNSSTPGVRLEPAGLFGYGTAGLTFALYSDPALKPYFSSGTILNVVYEVTTTSVIRTGTVNPRVQIDNSGIFAYAPGTATTPKFSVDAATGLLTASDGVFSGSVNASKVTGGTITGSYVSGGTVSGAVFTGGTVTSGTVSAAVFSGGTVTGALVSAGTVTGALVTAGTVSGGTVSGALVSAGTVSGAVISGGTVTGAVVTGGSITGGTITVSATMFLSGTIYGGTVMSALKDVGVYGGFYPFPDNSLYDGGPSNAWRGIYLRDGATGTNKILMINNGTVLIS